MKQPDSEWNQVVYVFAIFGKLEGNILVHIFEDKSLKDLQLRD